MENYNEFEKEVIKEFEDEFTHTTENGVKIVYLNGGNGGLNLDDWLKQKLRESAELAIESVKVERVPKVSGCENTHPLKVYNVAINSVVDEQKQKIDKFFN